LVIDKNLETSTDRIKLKVVVNKYVIGKEKFYGTKVIENNTIDTLIFNFNQKILVHGDSISADYNIKPISYAMEAFYIIPNTKKTWDVAWNTKSEEADFDNLILLADTNILTLAENRKIQNQKMEDYINKN